MEQFKKLILMLRFHGIKSGSKEFRVVGGLSGSRSERKPWAKSGHSDNICTQVFFITIDLFSTIRLQHDRASHIGGIYAVCWCCYVFWRFSIVEKRTWLYHVGDVDDHVLSFHTIHWVTLKVNFILNLCQRYVNQNYLVHSFQCCFRFISHLLSVLCIFLIQCIKFVIFYWELVVPWLNYTNCKLLDIGAKLLFRTLKPVNMSSVQQILSS